MLVIHRELLDEVRRSDRRYGLIDFDRYQGGGLLARSLAGRGSGSYNYPGLLLDDETPAGTIRFPFVRADPPLGFKPFHVQPDPSNLWWEPRISELGEALPCGYQPWLAHWIRESVSGLAVVGRQGARFVVAQGHAGFPGHFIWRNVPMSEYPISPLAFGTDSRLVARSIAIVGVGSIGSRVAELMAAGGARRLVLIDPDTLGAENLRRHLCGPEHVGRSKVEAVRDELSRRGWSTDVTVERASVHTDHPDAQRELLSSADLLICCADRSPAQHFVNHTAMRAGLPAVIADVQLLPEPLGEVVLAQPEGGCFNCWRERLAEDGVIMRSSGPDVENYGLPPGAPEDLKWYQLTQVAAAASDLAALATRPGAQSLVWLLPLETSVPGFPNVKPRNTLIEELRRLPRCLVCGS